MIKKPEPAYVFLWGVAIGVLLSVLIVNITIMMAAP